MGRSLDITTLGHMSIIDKNEGNYNHPYHNKIFFVIPNVRCTTLPNSRNWSRDGAMESEALEEITQAGEEDDSSEKDGKKRVMRWEETMIQLNEHVPLLVKHSF